MIEPAPAPHHPDPSALSAWLDGELTAGERQEMASHLAACPACAARLDELRALSADLKALPDDSLGFDLAALIAGRLDAPQRRPARSAAAARGGWFGRWPAGVGAAASIALGIALGSALDAGSGASAPRVAALSVFDAMPPGNLCIGLPSCYSKESAQ